MATQKKTETEVTEVKTEVMPVDPWSVKETVMLPRAGKNDEKSMYFACNGRSYNVPKGKPVEVPQPIAVMVREYMEAVEAVTAYEESMPNKG